MLQYKICSECGHKFATTTKDWMYRSFSGRLENPNDRNYKVEFQCSYTCNDHFKLSHERTSRVKEFPNKYNRDVDNCERLMIAQGKNILKPIKRITDTREDAMKDWRLDNGNI